MQQGPGHGPWPMVVVGLLLCLACSLSLTKLLMCVFAQDAASHSNEAELWLHENQLQQHAGLFRERGISSLVGCVTELGDLPELPAHDEERLQRAALLLQQRLILRQWLLRHQLQHHYQRLLGVDVASLDDVYWLEDSRARSLLGKDFVAWAAARQALPTSKEDLARLKADLWSAVVKSTQHEDAWTWGGMLVVSVSVAGLVTLAAMTQPALAPEAKHTLLQYVTGKYLLPGNCKVNFEWEDPQRVGETMTFTVKFYQRNGQPYPICDTDNLFVEVTEGSHRVATVSQLGGTDPSAANTAVVKFTVRHAGQYRIAVLIGSCHVQGSPFLKNFLPGPPDPHKTVFVRHSSTVVCTAGMPHSLMIEPRDEFDNLCVFDASSLGTDAPTEGYAIAITQVGSSVSGSCPSPPYTAEFDYDWLSHRVTLQVRFPSEGCFHASVSYRGTELRNGDFDIIVLSVSDAALVNKNVASKNHNICYEARLVSLHGERLSKPKKVFCYVSPKQLTVKELLLKFIPKRIITFRLCPSTKFTFLGNNNQYGQPSFIVDDGCQPKVELAAKDRNVIAATFTHFLLKNIGGSETFKDKQDFFYHEVRKYHQKHYHEKLPMKICREKLLESSMKATKNFSVSDWCRNFEITFQGEQGLDWGGVRREWFELVCAALFDARNGLFMSFSDGQQALVHPNVQRPPHLKLKHFEFAGRIVGKCLYESSLGGSYRQLVRARFTRSFLAQLIGLRVHYKYFEQDDPDLYLSKVKYILDNDVEEMELYFVEEEYDRTGQLTKVVELIPGGSKIHVRNDTKHQYLDSLAQYRLATSVRDEVDHFLKGLNELIPDNLLSIFDENELELLLCGTGEYSIADFRANHVVSGGSPEFRRVLDWFWTAVSNFTQEELARLLQFATGCSQLPPGGFAELSPRFQITAAPTFGSLPTAHTCFNQLCLPDYESYEQFEKALLLAISEGTEGFGMI
ncbi:apoptosis-resistant E3 ubiquitin protein ligase 1 isoform X2 [Schistocerca gregaria]|uniref:apoptosis-resistant E3 ubiquitin protein ligase 1 isoform X2 n=1 Tax=Schistocerca gregaria TaxID=7010 RepID=UPI00211E073D|nr:apoptosis-resistant E3 ubiquitin protein ligase 1 isoform X2 [Schistocerca gregaria]